MSQLNAAYDVINVVDFRRDGVDTLIEKLSAFADCYKKLSADDAKILRSGFDSKYKLGAFQSATALLQIKFGKFGSTSDRTLLEIFFALYSFDNLEFGYDSVISVIDASIILKGHEVLAKAIWLPFSVLTDNETAKRNLENKLFSI